MLVIEGKVFVNGDIKNTSVGIEDGKIVAVGNLIRGWDEKVDMGDKLIVPGAVDPHVHFRDPGLTKKEDFRTGTLSALHGGVTCVLDMPNTIPPVTDIRTLEEKKRTIRSKAYTDYGLFSAVTKDCDVRSLAKGSIGFKLFMGSTTGNILMNDDRYIQSIIREIHSTGKVISVHAEDERLITKDIEKNNHDHLKNRPAEAECSAVSRLVTYCKGAKINICHATVPKTVELAHSAGFTVESTMHHILFNCEKEGSHFKVNPPLREENARLMMMDLFLKGKMDMFGSDHAPHAEEEKEEFQASPSGMPGVETSLPMMMNMLRKGTISLGTICNCTAKNPGERFGINKGQIRKGYDADISVFDMKNVTVIDPDKLHGRSKSPVYAGQEAIFPKMVMVRGEIQIDDGEFQGKAIGEDVCGH